MDRRFVALGSVLAFLAVALGAFGAHALKTRISPENLVIWQTGVQYHLAHAAALLFVGILTQSFQDKLVRAAGWLFFAGILIFGGSLYALALTNIKVLGAITPLGGICFLAGWLSLAVGATQSDRTPKAQ